MNLLLSFILSFNISHIFHQSLKDMYTLIHRAKKWWRRCTSKLKWNFLSEWASPQTSFGKDQMSSYSFVIFLLSLLLLPLQSIIVKYENFHRSKVSSSSYFFLPLSDVVDCLQYVYVLCSFIFVFFFEYVSRYTQWKMKNLLHNHRSLTYSSYCPVVYYSHFTSILLWWCGEIFINNSCCMTLHICKWLYIVWSEEFFFLS